MKQSSREGQRGQSTLNRPVALPGGAAPPGDDAPPREAGAATVPRTLRIELSLRTMLTALGLGLGLWLFARLWPIPLVLATAAVLAGTLNPLLDALEARRLPRPLALSVLLLALLLPLVCLGALIVPELTGQVGDLAAIAPQVREQVAGALGGVPLLAPLADTVRGATLDRAAPLAAGVLPLAGQAAQGALLVLVTVVLTFYLLADRERVLGYLYALLPRRFHVRTARVLLDMETVVGGYVRGQAITSVLVAAYVFTVLTVAGTPHALALAVLSALADLVPFVGGVLVLVPTILATLGRGPGPALLVGVAILLYLWFESQVLVPHVYGRTLRLSPVAVTVALLVGGQLLGIVGALLALPLAAGVRVLLQDLRIDLPGEQTAEETEREREAQVEALYEARTAGTSALRAAAVAARLAEGLQAQDEATTGEPEIPAADRADLPPGAAPARSEGATS